METITEQDQAFTWYFRVLGYNSMGGVTGSLRTYSDDELEAVHDHVMAYPGTTSTFVVGPFREGRS